MGSALRAGHRGLSKEPPAGYKRTEVGVIPSAWDAVQLGDLFEFKNGLNKAKQFFGSGTPIVNYMDVFECPGIRMNDLSGRVNLSPDEIKKFQVRLGDVFFTRTSETVEEIGVASVMLENPCDTVFSGFVLRARPRNDRLDDRYKQYSFGSKAVRSQIISNATYTTRALTNGRSLSAVWVAVPPNSEQRAIAEALSDVDGLLAALEALIAKKQAIKQAAMQQLLAGKTRLPGFSGEWETGTFGEIFQYYPTATNSRNDLLSAGDTFYIHYGDIHTRFHNHLDFGVVTPPRIDRSRCSNAALLKNGDWVMADASEDHEGVGKSIEIQGLNTNMAAVAGLHTFLLREKIPTFSPSFKGHLGNLRSLHDQFLRVATGLKVFGVSKAALKEIEIPIPHPEEQTAIATILSGMDAEITALEAKLSKIRQLKQGMMQELLTGRIRLL